MTGWALRATERAEHAGTGAEARRAVLARLGDALDALGVTAWPAPGGKLVLSLWPGLHAGVSLDATRYGWTEAGLVVTWPAGDVAGTAHLISHRLNVLTGGWRP